MLNTIKYLYLSNKASSFNATIVKQTAEKIYSTSITSLPKTLTSKNSQVTADFTLSNDMYVMNEVYSGNYGIYENDTLLFEKAEQYGNYIYFYNKLIVNSSLGQSGCGTISRLDGSGTIYTNEIYNQDQCPIGEELYTDFPDYFTTYKHTFIKSGNDIQYISSEPIVE